MKYIFFLSILITNTIYATKAPEIKKIISNEVVRYDKNTLFVKSKIEIYNPNIIAIKFNELKLDFREKNTKIADGINVGNSFLPSRKSVELEFQIQIFLDSISNSYLEDLVSKDSIEFKCHASGTIGMFRIKISEDLTFKLSTDEMLNPIKNNFIENANIQINNLKIDEINLDKIKINASLNVYNNLPFDLEILSTDLSIYSDKLYDSKVGNSVDSNEVILKSKKELSIEKKLTLNTLNTGISGLVKIFKKEIDYYIKGFAEIKLGKHQLKVPVEKKIVIDPVNRTIK
jgi:LEA14-like dessication related protein